MRESSGLLPQSKSATEGICIVAGANIDVRALAGQLQDEGAKSFVKSWNDLMRVIDSKSTALKRAS